MSTILINTNWPIYVLKQQPENWKQKPKKQIPNSISVEFIEKKKNTDCFYLLCVHWLYILVAKNFFLHITRFLLENLLVSCFSYNLMYLLLSLVGIFCIHESLLLFYLSFDTLKQIIYIFRTFRSFFFVRTRIKKPYQWL